MRLLRIALFGVAVFAAATVSAEARKSRHHRSSSSSSSSSTPTQNDIPMTDPNAWCSGGFPITDDQQIRGCTAIIDSRRDKGLRATAFYNRGNAKFSKGDINAAISDYTSAVEIKSDYIEAIYNRAVAYRAMKNYGMAIIGYSQALSLTPNDPAALTGRGTAYGMKGDNAHAIADLSQAITLGTRDVTARLQRGHAYVRLQRWAEALADYDQVLATAPSNPEAFFGRACAKIYSGDVKGGTQDLTQAYLLDQSILETMVAQGISSPVVVKPEGSAAQNQSDPTIAPLPATAPAPQAAKPGDAPTPASDTPPPASSDNNDDGHLHHSWGN